MNQLRNFHFNLGLPHLLSEWKKMFTTKNLAADITAGTTVAFIAIPLSLAIALASGVSPATGLVTAIIAGFVCALFGGTPLAVSGPAAAMSVIIADVVERFGVQTLVFICLIAGLMQLISGMLGLGKLGRYVPLPVISGFTAGIGVIILIGQLPRAFGLMPPPESHIFTVFTHLKDYIHEINGTCILIVALTILVIRGMPKFLPKIPSILPAVIFTSCIAYFFSLNDVPLIGAIPRTLPAPQFPAMPQITMNELLLNSFVIYLLASLETLLSSSAIDKMTQGKKHNSDQELIGQGLGNVAVSLFGGIPITGVIARSATNVRAGAKTRRSSIIHSLILLLTVFFAAPLISMIPIAALAGVLFSVAFSMVNYKEFRDLWLISKSEAAIYTITFFTIIFVDLLAGVQAGIIAAALIVLWRATQTHLNISMDKEDGVARISLVGALTFLSIGKIAELQKRIESEFVGQIVLLDLSSVRNLDTSGATAIIELYQHCIEHDVHFYIKGLPRRFESLFEMCGGRTLLEERYLISEQELKQKNVSIAPKSSRGRLIHGVHRFYAERQHNDKRLFEAIAKKQNPHTFFIACSDSRVVPTMITSADPGELFIIRNIGNYVPPYQSDSIYSEFAALEFALNNFDITDIVVCGHASCGAMKACCTPLNESWPHSLKNWISMIKSQLTLHDVTKVNDVARMNVMNQIENLKQYPVVRKKLETGILTLHGWFFDFDEGLVYEFDSKNNQFKSVVSA